MEPESFEVLTRPAFRFPRLELSSFALDAQSVQAPPDVAIEVVESLRGVPSAEVVAPSPNDRVDVGDELADIRVTAPSRGLLSHALPDPLHGALRRPAMQEVQASPLVLPDPSAQLLV